MRAIAGMARSYNGAPEPAVWADNVGALCALR